MFMRDVAHCHVFQLSDFNCGPYISCCYMLSNNFPNVRKHCIFTTNAVCFALVEVMVVSYVPPSSGVTLQVDINRDA